MATIVFFCIPAHGHTNPTLNVVRELVTRGNRVVYYSYDEFREKIEDAGAEFVSCNGFDAQLCLTREEGAKIGSDLALSTRVLVDTTLAATSKGVELLEEELGCVAAGKGTPAPDEEKPKNQTNPFL